MQSWKRVASTALIILAVSGCDKLKEIWEEIQDSNTTTTTTIPAPTTTTIPTPTTTIPAVSNPVCGGTHYPPNGDGFLWKPESEGNGKLVVLLPYNHKKKHNRCTIYDGQVADSCSWAGFHNGGRQHWRCSKPGNQYNAPALVLCNDGEQDCAWHIPTPWDRIE